MRAQFMVGVGQEGEGPYGLLGSDVIGVSGHGLRGLDLLLDDGRHLLVLELFFLIHCEKEKYLE